MILVICVNHKQLSDMPQVVPSCDCWVMCQIN